VWIYVDQDAVVVAEVAAVVGRRRTDRAARVTRAVGIGVVKANRGMGAAVGVVGVVGVVGEARCCRRCRRAFVRWIN
jgi:hypothetical protein